MNENGRLNRQVIAAQQQVQEIQAQAAAVIHAEIRATAREIFACLAAECYEDHALHDIDEALKARAKFAERAAPYLPWAYGQVNIDADKHWPKPAPSEA